MSSEKLREILSMAGDGKIEIVWGSDELSQLQNVTSLMASYLGHSQGLFGMELAGHSWTDGDDYMYFPKHKKLSDFTMQECIDTLNHVYEWLNNVINDRYRT